MITDLIILAGVTAILTVPSPSLSNDRENQKEDKKDKIPALIAAVYFFVCTKLSGRETTGQEYASRRKVIVSALAKLRDELSGTIHGKKEEGTVWEGWERVGTKDVDEMVNGNLDSWLAESGLVCEYC
jgi:origin recognition complex subunit 6